MREVVLAFRKDYGISQRKFAKLCGISPTTLMKIEKGKEPGLIVRGKIENAMQRMENAN